MEGGIWTAGLAQALVHDMRPCAELISRMIEVLGAACGGHRLRHLLTDNPQGLRMSPAPEISQASVPGTCDCFLPIFTRGLQTCGHVLLQCLLQRHLEALAE